MYEINEYISMGSITMPYSQCFICKCVLKYDSIYKKT